MTWLRGVHTSEACEPSLSRRRPVPQPRVAERVLTCVLLVAVRVGADGVWYAWGRDCAASVLMVEKCGEVAAGGTRRTFFADKSEAARSAHRTTAHVRCTYTHTAKNAMQRYLRQFVRHGARQGAPKRVSRSAARLRARTLGPERAPAEPSVHR